MKNFKFQKTNSRINNSKFPSEVSFDSSSKFLVHHKNELEERKKTRRKVQELH